MFWSGVSNIDVAVAAKFKCAAGAVHKRGGLAVAHKVFATARLSSSLSQCQHCQFSLPRPPRVSICNASLDVTVTFVM